MKPRRTTWQGFTLIELLVVIGIVAIMIAMVLPALEHARQKADDAKCAANLRNIAMGSAQYMADNNEILPWTRTTGWCVPADLVPSPPAGAGHYPQYFFEPLAGRGPDPPYHHEMDAALVAWIWQFATYSCQAMWPSQVYPYGPAKAMFECDSYGKYSFEQLHHHRYWYYPPDPTTRRGWMGAAQSDYGPNEFIMAEYGNHWNGFFYSHTDSLRVTDIPNRPESVVYLGHSAKHTPWENLFDGEQGYCKDWPANCASLMPHYWRGTPTLDESYGPFMGVDTGGPSPLLYCDMSVRLMSVDKYDRQLDRVIGP